METEFKEHLLLSEGKEGSVLRGLYQFSQICGLSLVNTCNLHFSKKRFFFVVQVKNLEELFHKLQLYNLERTNKSSVTCESNFIVQRMFPPGLFP